MSLPSAPFSHWLPFSHALSHHSPNAQPCATSEPLLVPLLSAWSSLPTLGLLSCDVHTDALDILLKCKSGQPTAGHLHAPNEPSVMLIWSASPFG